MGSAVSGIGRVTGWIAAGVLLLLTGCAGTISQDLRVKGDVSRLEGVAEVVAQLSPEAARLQAGSPQFKREELSARLRYRLEAKGLTAPTASHRVEIVVTDVRVRGAVAAILFGAMAGSDHVTGSVRVLDASGRALRSFEVNASYAFGGLAGGQDGVRLGWLYDKFADLAFVELEKLVMPPRSAGAPVPATAPIAVAAATPAARAGSVASIDNVDAVPVSERGRAVYREWLTQRKPRAFVISDNGYFYGVWGTRPPDPNESSDPTERGMQRCQNAGRPNCTVYAVDDRVVYTRPGPFAAH